jgi:hypothetical protein
MRGVNFFKTVFTNVNKSKQKFTFFGSGVIRDVLDYFVI